ncbi:HDOD domain-containing protein [Neptunomonas antarctica]|uniref:GAF domain-containing protein n=1 Tax=Neptunomonas antarctica TaxID=619304 RepID=A0A1N7LZE7_9GAMM|nr:HDOD domain-containing protein [Neptunomonas antarctica]SIS79194.1 GAF domain-containing protein [Neptunomonas antarctica]
MVKYQQTLKSIHTQLGRGADLPVFSASLNRIQELSRSPEGDAMVLAMAILKDASLSAKLLRIANTPEFNRGIGKVAVISRAVILLGFNRIKNLSISLKLIENFNDAHPDSGLEKLLLRAFLNASMARELAAKAGIRDIEETFLCGLLFNLGEIIVSSTMPDVYKKMCAAKALGKQSWSSIQLSELGGQFSDIGQDLAQSWGFPPTVVKTMDEMTAGKSDKLVYDQHLLISFSHTLIEKVYGEQVHEDNFGLLSDALETRFSLLDQDVEACFDDACKLAANMVEEYGIDLQGLVPVMQETGDPKLDDCIRRTAYFFHSRKQLTQPEGIGVKQPKKKNDSPEKQLNYLNRLAELTAENGAAHTILSQVVEGIKACTSYDRVIFCLYRKAPPMLSMKIAEGESLEGLECFFTEGRPEVDMRLFFHIIKKEMTLLVSDVNEAGWKERLPPAFIKEVNPRGMVIAPLVIRGKVIGLFYADRTAQPLDDTDFTCFNQFAIQAKIALSHRA